MFYGKGNHIVNSILYLAVYVAMQLLLLSMRDVVALWRIVLFSIPFASAFVVGGIGELALRRKKLEEKDEKSIEKTREKFMYLLGALIVIIGLAAIFLFYR